MPRHAARICLVGLGPDRKRLVADRDSRGAGSRLAHLTTRSRSAHLERSPDAVFEEAAWRSSLFLVAASVFHAALELERIERIPGFTALLGDRMRGGQLSCRARSKERFSSRTPAKRGVDPARLHARRSHAYEGFFFPIFTAAAGSWTVSSASSSVPGSGGEGFPRVNPASGHARPYGRGRDARHRISYPRSARSRLTNRFISPSTSASVNVRSASNVSRTPRL